MNQTKLESGIEVLMNYLTGFLISWMVYEWLVIPNPSFASSGFWVTMLYTWVSVIRTYLWRRFFNAGLHKIVHTTMRGIYGAFKSNRR